ncbi:MAG: type II secretion system F family protein [Firmicutes bacterium]|nr:type II secretion system F family protein [Bacillota bacterium]
MTEFVYRAADARGKIRRGMLAAANRAEAMASLRAQGLFPLEVEETGRPLGRNGRTGGDLLAFTQQLATMLGAGLQLDRAMGLAGELYGGTSFGRILADVRRRLQEGASFSTALAAHPRVFGRLYVNMVRAGETGGVLPIVLRRLAQTIEEERDLRGYLLSAFLYPSVVAGASLLAVVILLGWVVPRFALIFARLGQDLPTLTRLTLALSRFLAAYGLWCALGLSAAAVIGWTLLRSPAGQMAWERFLLEAPLLGDLYRKLVTARLTRTLAMLLGAGVPVLDAFNVTAETSTNHMVKNALARAAREIGQGGSIARRLAAQGVLPAMAVQMIAVGEETGELASMLEQVAKAYEAETRRTIRNLLALLEPALILILTGITLLIALSILLPMVGMSAGL